MTKFIVRLGALILMAPATALAIVGGKTVRLDGSAQVAGVVAVLNQETGEICSGTLLESRVILTAAHCVGKAASSLFIFVGEKVDEPRALFIADAAVAHVNYDGYLKRDENDLALLHFNGGLPKTIRPAKLVDGAVTLPPDAQLTIAGYGVASMKNGGQGDGVLRQAEVALHRADFAATELTLDQSQGRGGCAGDSGGPAFIKISGELRLVGVLSRPEEANHTCRKPTVYTKVAAFSEWIQINSRALAAKSKNVFQARLLKN